MKNGMFVTAVIFAGGVGSRMHSRDIPKQFLHIHGKPILVHTLEVFQKTNVVDHIVVACHADWIEHCQRLVEQHRLSKVHDIVSGGETGQLSIYSGLQAASKISTPESTIVLIHDGVRPLIDEQTINTNIDDVCEFGSAITCVPAKETILLDDNNITIIPRQHAMLARAPQSFILKDILAAHEQALSEGQNNFIDSATLMKTYGYKLHIVEGSYQNMKITTQDDYYALRAILDSKENTQLYDL